MTGLKYSHIKSICDSDIKAFDDRLKKADEMIKNRSGKGSDFLGWLDLPETYDRDEFERIKASAARLRKSTDVLLVIGIGGSYLGARAGIEFLCGSYYNRKNKFTPDIYFIGNSFSGEELKSVFALCEGKRVSAVVISKSGTTTESAIGFRFVLQYLQGRYEQDELKERILIIADGKKSILKDFAEQNGNDFFVIPADIGGRYSVLTAVGLLPMAACGIDIDALMRGARNERELLFSQGLKNNAYTYAVLRNIFYEKGKKVEVLASYDPSFRYMGEWFKQLFGESEGKDKKGLFPSSVIYSSDLHSLGQFIQDGAPILFETICRQKSNGNDLKVPLFENNSDGLNYLAGKSLFEINDTALLGTLLAHENGGTDGIIIEYGKKNAEVLGELIYFFFLSCAASGYMLGINPFDQPGVENYKRNMFALLGKPGYEERKTELEEKIKSL